MGLKIDDKMLSKAEDFVNDYYVSLIDYAFYGIIFSALAFGAVKIGQHIYKNGLEEGLKQIKPE